MNDKDWAAARKKVEDKMDVNLVQIRNSLDFAASEVNRAIRLFEDDAYASLDKNIERAVSELLRVKRATCENAAYLSFLKTLFTGNKKMEEEK